MRQLLRSDGGQAKMNSVGVLLLAALVFAQEFDIRSARSGDWTDAGIWEPQRAPRAVVYGAECERFIRSIRDVDYNFHRWRVKLSGVQPGTLTLRAHAVDAAGNVEKNAHVLTVRVK